MDGQARVGGVSAAAPADERTMPRPVHEDDDLRITAFGDPAEPGVVLCFTGFQNAMGGVAPEQFVRSSRLSGFSTMFVSDRRLSWFNAIDPARFFGIGAPLVAGRRVVAIGNSMGGFGAIWVSALIETETVIAFAPQWSVHPDVMSQEERWPRQRAAIAEWRVESLDGRFVAGTRYVTLNGEIDRAHWRHFPFGPGRDHLLIADAGHDAAQLIRRHGALEALIADCVGGGDALACLTRHGVAAERIHG